MYSERMSSKSFLGICRFLNPDGPFGDWTGLVPEEPTQVCVSNRVLEKSCNISDILYKGWLEIC